MLEDPDVEQLIVDYLGPAMASAGFAVPVSTRKTADDCVVVYLVGGFRPNRVVGNPSMVIDAYSKLESQASAYCRRAHALVHDLEGQTLDGTLIYRVQDFRSPISDPKPPDLIRYSAMASISLSLNRIS